MMKRITRAWSLVVGLAVAAVPGCAQDYSWKVVNTMISSDFPGVRHITTDSLAEWLGDSSRTPPTIIDTRQPGEYNVSHLKGALLVDPDATDFPQLASLDKNAPIVAYCSVGYRSAQITERLTSAGFTNVINLRGSIFQWANEGRPVYDNSGSEVHRVHPYDRVWGVLLEKELHSYRTK